VHQPVNGSAAIRPYYIIIPTSIRYIICYNTVLRRASVSGKNLRNMVSHLLRRRRRTRAMRLQYYYYYYYLRTLSAAVVGAHVARGGVKERTAHGTAV